MEKSLQCDFESAYACGYRQVVDGRIQWERASVEDGDLSLSPDRDASGNSKGDKILSIDTYYLVMIFLPS